MSLRTPFHFFLGASLAAACLLAQSQAPTLTPAQEQRLQQRVQEAKDKLQVTPDQIDKLRPVLTTEMQQFRDLLNKYGDPREASMWTKVKMRHESRSIQDQTDGRLKQILSKQQMKAFQQLRDEWREEWKQELKNKGWQPEG